MTNRNHHFPIRDWHSLLNRSLLQEAAIPSLKIAASLSGKRVLVTGAGGYLGSALARSIARKNVRELVLLDSSESALYEIDQAMGEFESATPPVAALVNICDTTAISRMFDRYRPEVIFHAAAFKHVPLMESNPFAVLANNALGTKVLAETAKAFHCEQMVMISTDKAVDPISIMGASKRIAELIILAPHTGSTCMRVVRLGNVLGSSGSVVPLFTKQIARGGPVTVTHPEVHRYFLTLTEAVQSLLSALSPETPLGLSVPELGEPVRILDLAKYLIGDKDVPIVFTELRPGDKMEESLISQREHFEAAAGNVLRAVRSPTLPADQISAALDEIEGAIQQRNLSFLLSAIQHLVPEYQPSLRIRDALQTTTEAVSR